MKQREAPPFAAMGVVIATAAIFIYFSCSGGRSADQTPAGTSTEAATETFHKEMADDDVAFDPSEADFTAALLSGCQDISLGSPSCDDSTPANSIGKEP